MKVEIPWWPVFRSMTCVLFTNSTMCPRPCQLLFSFETLYYALGTFSQLVDLFHKKFGYLKAKKSSEQMPIRGCGASVEELHMVWGSVQRVKKEQHSYYHNMGAYFVLNETQVCIHTVKNRGNCQVYKILYVYKVELRGIWGTLSLIVFKILSTINTL